MPSSLAAIYPGSFDPPTNGHLDLIARGAGLAGHLIVAVLENTQKQALFAVEERVEMLKEATAQMKNVEIDSFGGLLADYAARRGVNLVLRGLRGAADFETEAQMAEANRRLRPGLETIFLAAGAEYSFLSSRMVKEIAMLGGDAAAFVPEGVLRRLRLKFPARLK